MGNASHGDVCEYVKSVDTSNTACDIQCDQLGRMRQTCCTCVQATQSSFSRPLPTTCEDEVHILGVCGPNVGDDCPVLVHCISQPLKPRELSKNVKPSRPPVIWDVPYSTSHHKIKG